MEGRRGLVKRFGSYWRVEVANAGILPVAAVVITRGNVSPATVIALVPMCALLIVGGLYWRAKLLRLTGDPQPLGRLLLWAERLRPVFAFGVAAGVVAAALAWVESPLAKGVPDRLIASGAAALGVAEYVNYYHRQLQHFDRWSDFRRLVAGRGFRRSHLARDLARQRARIPDSCRVGKRY